LLSEHFGIDEFCRSNAAIRLGVDMTPPPAVVACLTLLAVNSLEPLRAHLGKPIRITSGYRPVALNQAIGGARNSQHVLGQAADIQVDGMTPLEVCHAIIEAKLPFDQLIHEFDAWTHVSFNPKGPQRGDILTATHGTYGAIYSPGLPV
jgi:hypothetical protein